jgi:hypothetical protein
MQSQIDLDGLANFINAKEIPLEKSRIGFSSKSLCTFNQLIVNVGRKRMVSKKFIM